LPCALISETFTAGSVVVHGITAGVPWRIVTNRGLGLAACGANRWSRSETYHQHILINIHDKLACIVSTKDYYLLYFAVNRLNNVLMLHYYYTSIIITIYKK
jgi:hypothetical protein